MLLKPTSRYIQQLSLLPPGRDNGPTFSLRASGDGSCAVAVDDNQAVVLIGGGLNSSLPHHSVVKSLRCWPGWYLCIVVYYSFSNIWKLEEKWLCWLLFVVMSLRCWSRWYLCRVENLKSDDNVEFKTDSLSSCVDCYLLQCRSHHLCHHI